jgi:glycerol kinase
LRFFTIPESILPEIKSSSEYYGDINQGILKGIPITAVLGDQQASLVGQLCLKKGSAQITYGTGCFLMYNTGNDVVYSQNGLITTVAYQFGNEKPVYALEGSVAIGGAAIEWLKNNMEIIESAKDSEEVASQVKDTGDVYFVPAFSGLFAPHWRTDARGLAFLSIS